MKFFDTFVNFLAGFGMPGRDKAVEQQFTLPLLSVAELTAAYRGDWVSRKAVDIPALDCTREWRAWQADRQDITKLEDGERRHGAQRKLEGALKKSRLFGGAVMIMGVEDGTDFMRPLDVKKVKKGALKFVHVVQRWQIHAGPIVRNVLDDRFGQPAYYLRTNVPIGGDILAQFHEEINKSPEQLLNANFKYDPGGMVVIHPSRVVRFVGNEYPDIETAPDQWGDSVLQTVHDAVRHAGIVTSSIATMVAEAKLDVIKIPGLGEILSTPTGTENLTKRFQYANTAKSVINALLLDTKEEWERMQIHPEGLPKVLEAYFMIACAAVDVPATRFLGKSPDGMNSTGESDLRNYYDRIKADQTMRLQPAMSVLDQVMMRDALGEVNEEDGVTYLWNPLWQMDAPAKADVALKKAQAHQVDVNMGLLNPLVLKKARENQLIEDGTYPGLEQILEDEVTESDDEVLNRLMGQAQEQSADDTPQDDAGNEPDEPTTKLSQIEKGGAADAFPFDGDWSESLHPRAQGGRFGNKGKTGTAVKKRTATGERGGDKERGSSSSEESGSYSKKEISDIEDFWHDYGGGALIKSISRGDTPKAGDLDSNGDKITEEMIVKAYRAERYLQSKAETSIVSAQVFKGLVLPKGTDVRSLFKRNAVIEMDSLSAASKDRSIAEEYTDPQLIGEEEGEEILLDIQRNGGVIGYQFSSGDYDEAVLPKGAKYRVARVVKEDGKTIITLYDNGKLNVLKKQ